ncbi:MAG: hypothetical protein JWM64_690 [Frankiales bacterium]|nr:hypothetical protein [Frankiales bacterium]
MGGGGGALPRVCTERRSAAHPPAPRAALRCRSVTLPVPRRRRRGLGLLVAVLLLLALVGGAALLQRDDAGAGARLQQRCGATGSAPTGGACP